MSKLLVRLHLHQLLNSADGALFRLVHALRAEVWTRPFIVPKTFDMLGCCAPDTAAWSNNGRSFVVKSPKAFEKTMLPLYFKHNNFASFARQLRFYGFEKTKKLEVGPGSELGASMWEFTHPKFRRDDPSKMASIRRKTCTEPNSKWDKEDVDMLKSKMTTLQTQLSTLSEQIGLLTSMVHEFAEHVDEDEAAAAAGATLPYEAVDMLALDQDELYAEFDYDFFGSFCDKNTFEPMGLPLES
ncbi:HSF-type DNA-binding [Achlya hypogyna]|uniref:HSF-type DNA-binding n=1 Tax=Achlya hypogyna TaxID=1202772 RepID=A0A1V9Z8B0_ACHHY|nr:HSF-type DNA-binding [Achlya hypogyna]